MLKKLPVVLPQQLTDEEFVARFPNLWEEVWRSSFKTGGDDEEFLDKVSLKSANEEEAAMIEIDEEGDVDDDDDDIPQEDRVAAM